MDTHTSHIVSKEKITFEIYIVFQPLTPWANSANDKLTIFSFFFSEKKGFVFHANCLLRRQFA